MYRDDCCNQRPHHNSCPWAPESRQPKCPICGKETDMFYLYKAMEIVGCDECILPKAAWEVHDAA